MRRVYEIIQDELKEEYINKEKLSIVISTYDPCFLITTTKEVFGVVRMQTDDILILGSEKFLVLEEDELNKAKLSAKPKEALSPETLLIFNGCVLTQQGDMVELRQKEQGKKLQTINEKGENL